MKKALTCVLALLLAVLFITPAAADPSDTGDTATYSLVSAVVSEPYDFYVDFAPWVHEDMSPGDTFILADDRPNVTLTLKNDLTGETVEVESRYQTGCYVEAETATLLTETTELPATLTVSALSGYDLPRTSLPVTITVTSSPGSAVKQRYMDVTRALSTDMTEGADFTVDGERTSSAKIAIRHAPAAFQLSLFDFETRQTLTFSGDDPHLTFETASELDYFSQTDDTYYFPLAGKIVLDDGYEYEFTLNVHAHPAGSDYVRSVETGDPFRVTLFASVLLLFVGAAILISLRRKRKTL